MKWFRFYGEVLNDPKVQALGGDTFKFWVNCLCVASQNDGHLPPVGQLAFLLRATPEAAAGPLDTLVQAGLIDAARNQHGASYYVHAWQERQYKSDTSTERVKRFRRRCGAVPETGRNRARTESDPESDSGSNSNSNMGLAFSIDHVLSFAARKRCQARAAELNRDFRHLCETFDAFVARKGRPANPDAAFAAWIESYTKGEKR